ncbi:MAG TPA: hypothetical protein VEV81_12985 [Pyrinomonadaceae bacterium]|nr:hypothetical protein [Pyrinomonadaceae bacterium]
MTIPDGRNMVGAQGGTRQRIIECRRRLRQIRATRRSLRLAQDCAVVAAEQLLLAAAGSETGFIESEEIFEEAGLLFSRKSRQSASEVDRRTGLRAR